MDQFIPHNITQLLIHPHLLQFLIHQHLNQQTHLAEFPHIDSGLAVLMFKQGDDPIEIHPTHLPTIIFVYYHHICSSTNNQLRNSSNPRQQATIHDGRYLFETQNAAVQDTNSSTQQDAMILSVFEQLSNQVTNCKKVNEDNLIANETLSAELERYKERVKLLEERQNVDLALGFQNPFYLKKAQQIRPMLYDGNVIAKETNVISIVDSEETLMLEEESRSKMILKQSDPMVLEKKVNIKPINYAELNRLSEDFGKRFVPQHELSDEQAFRLQTSHPNTNQSASSPVKIKAPRELPKTLKDIFNVFDKDLLNEVTELQTVFNQMEAAVQQYHVEKQCFEIQKKQFLIENDRLLDQIISQDIVNIVVNSSMDLNTSVNVNYSVATNDSVNYVEMCNKCLELKAELIKQHNMVEKDEYNRLSKSFSKLEQHCISLELAMQLNKEIFQKNNTFVNQTELSFDQLFELNNLKAELQAKDTTIEKLKATLNAWIKLSPQTLDPVTLASKDKNNRETHIYYLKHIMEQAAILREIVEQAKSLNPSDSASYSACKYVKLIQDLLEYVRDTCPDIHNPSEKLVAVTPINKIKTVRFAEPVMSSSTSPKQLGFS
ncbi:hypothetical protein Tco_0737107 [Tanacetum coccineum]